MNKTIFFLLITIFSASFACGYKKQVLEEKKYDFKQIIDTGEITLITLNSSTSYFIYKDEPMGYDYELAKEFADFYGLKLNVKTAENSTRLLQMLDKGEGDLIGYGIPIQNSMKDSILYCGPNQISHQVLVQRDYKKKASITDVTQLIGKEVYIKEGTKYALRLNNLNAELGSGVIIKNIEQDSITVEDLIRMVATEQIDYTIADEYIAKINKTYFKNINISLPVSFEQRSSWVVRKNMPQLAQALDEWFAENSKKATYKSTLKKYFEESKNPIDSAYLEALSKIIYPKGEISSYDHLFKRYAVTSGYDWYLLAAIAYQESRFRLNLTSWAGAVGLMGLMPRTAAIYGVEGDDLKDPEMSIMAGANYLKYLTKIFKKIDDPDERVKFVLASYNGGHGHIFDARALARKYGDNPDVWDSNVEKWIELKSKPEYYNDSVVRFGYLRGTEVINYVRDVTNNWQRFKDKDHK